MDSRPDPLIDFVHPDTALSGDLNALCQPWVRDIAWLLHAPDMATIGYRGRPSLAELGLDDAWQRRHWLLAQQLETAAFADLLQQRRSSRLGIYHEALWHWILARAPNTRLLANNVALRDDSRTLGELDLFYADSSPNAGLPGVTHAELAIKFYLGLPNGPSGSEDAARWIGLGSVDSLAIKTHHLQHKQLPMALTALSDPLLSTALPAQHFTQRVIMPGCLYHPWHQRLPLPRLASREAPHGMWCHIDDWHDLAAALPADCRGALLNKPHWLAPPPQQAWCTLHGLSNALASHFHQHRAARHVLLTLTDGRQCRLFVMANDWPRVIPLPPLGPGYRTTDEE